MACKKKDIFQQPPRPFVSGFEQSVQKIQRQIYQAKIKGQIAHVHALQKRLCESFSAKFLAIEYATTSLRLNRVPVSSLTALCNCQEHNKDLRPFTCNLHAKVVQNKVDANSACKASLCTHLKSKNEAYAKQSFARASLYETKNINSLSKTSTTSRKKVRGIKEFKTTRCKQGCRRVETVKRAPEDWKISVAQSLWNAEKEDEEHVKRGFAQTFNTVNCSGKTNDRFTKKSQISGSLEQSIKEKVKKEAKQIHALLALEPEWQAFFSRVEKKTWNAQSKAAHVKRDLVRQKELDLKQKRKVKESASGFEYFLRPNVFKRKKVLKSNQLIKCIQKYMQSSLPQFAFTMSLDRCLHTIDHQVLVQKLNTFKAMENQIKIWLQAGILENTVITSRHRSEIKDSRLQAHHTFWCLSTFLQPCRQDSSVFNPSLKKAFPWLPSQYSLYSCFPQVLWQEQVIVHNTTQIEEHTYRQSHAITRLFLRILFYDLLEGVEQIAQNSLNSNFKQTDSILSREDQLLQKQQNLFCTGDSDNLIIIHSDKKFLEMCVLKASQYFPGILTCNKAQPVLQDKKRNKGSAKQSFATSRDYSQAVSTKTKTAYTSSKACFLNKDDGLSFVLHKERSSFQKLLLSEIRDCRQGFTFLGFQLTQIARQDSSNSVKTTYMCKVTPSKESIRTLVLFIRNRIKQSQNASTSVWIARINLLLCKWVEYYKICEYKRSYHKISYLVWEKIRSWLSRRSSKRRSGTQVQS